LSPQKMLASTVQFSRDGRAREFDTSPTDTAGGSRGSRSGGPGLPDPSGPNSAPGPTASVLAFPLPKGKYWPARARAIPNNRRSTSELCSMGTCAPHQHDGRPQGPPNCSLERR